MRTRRFFVAAVALAMALSVLPGPLRSNEALAADDEPPMFLGMATLNLGTVFPAFAAETGKYPAFHQVFWKIHDQWEQSVFDGIFNALESHGSHVYAEVHTDDLAALVTGGQDAELAALASQVKAGLDARPGMRLLVAPLPEMNLPEHAWGVQPDLFPLGYNKIRDAFIDAGLGPDRIRFIFSVNGPGYRNAYSDFYPGDDVVDLVGFSKINRNNPWLGYDEVFQRFIDQMRSQVTREKPIFITQTGSVSEGGDRDQWLRDMFRNLKDHDQVIGAVYFNRDKFEAGQQNNYLVATEDWVDPVFDAEYQNWAAPSDVTWIFDGPMDSWVEAREDLIEFDDIDGSPFADSILWLAEQGITGGCGDYLFCPDLPVTRAQMASFIIRSVADGPSAFDFFDDDDGSTHEDNINGMAHAEITLGCGTRQYCPNDPVTRAQMASFLVRAFNLAPVGSDYFADDDGSTHEANINALAADGITLGCGGDSYCPNEIVTRGQMAAFLDRALND